MIRKTLCHFLISVFGLVSVSHAQIDFSEYNTSDLLYMNARSVLIGDVDFYIHQQDNSSPAITLIETSFLTKIPLNSRVNFLIGAKLDQYRDNLTGETDWGTLMSTGIEIQPTENTSINLLYNLRLNELPNNLYHYNTFSKSSFGLGTGFKF